MFGKHPAGHPGLPWPHYAGGLKKCRGLHQRLWGGRFLLRRGGGGVGAGVIFSAGNGPTKTDDFALPSPAPLWVATMQYFAPGLLLPLSGIGGLCGRRTGKTTSLPLMGLGPCGLCRKKRPFLAVKKPQSETVFCMIYCFACLP